VKPELIEQVSLYEEHTARLRRSVKALWRGAEAFEACSGGVADPEAGAGPLHVSPGRARPFCGECGDSGIEPEEVMLGYVRQGRWGEGRQECAACPRCAECGVELRLHPRDTGECP
jgi:hypothetical protein